MDFEDYLEGGYSKGDGAIADYDQLKAHASDHLREADSFVVVAGYVDDSMQSGMRLITVSATKTAFAPYFLAEAVAAVSSVMLQSIEQLNEEDAETA